MKRGCWSYSRLELGDHLSHRCLPIAINGPAQQDGPMDHPLPRAYRWIKTECGRAKYDQLAAKSSLFSRLRLALFVLIATIRDWRLPPPDHVPSNQTPGSEP